jgi:hypothetical protein
MNSFYFLLAAFFLYLSFGTIVDSIIKQGPSTQYARIHAKVLFRTYYVPVLFGLVMFYILITGRQTLNVFIGGGILFGSLTRIFSANKKYLTAFEVEGNVFKISYLTPFLSLRSRQFNTADISDIELVKANWLIEHPAAVNVKQQEGWITFDIIDKQLKAIVQKHIDIANNRQHAGMSTVDYH